MTPAIFIYFVAIIVEGCRAPSCFSKIKFDPTK
uniref:Uncharacterized protein n=1 Tax=Drosophila melanogaster TaxID=7227 RepID=M9NF92_DROME|nr:uncharacterized protein Dmel_CG43362 [Drosophila melanogaster]AFH03750.1 uncharacterized protein Dmel_CG43362 [Drosophila melanogaster]|eukprot:NP_001246076.1 uncharacterized protein Dmel_CG43362 [Drosophila melanogaster]